MATDDFTLTEQDKLDINSTLLEKKDGKLLSKEDVFA